MHQYLRATGFDEFITSEQDLEVLLSQMLHNFDQRKVVKLPESNRVFLELSRSFGPNIGIRMCGWMEQDGFHRTCYFPYLYGDGVTTDVRPSIEMKVAGDGYTGLIEESRVGVCLLFYVQNIAEYFRETVKNKRTDHVRMTTTFSGLSLGGMILLPGREMAKAETKRRGEFYRKHSALVEAARNGNREAIEDLTMEEMDTYAMISRRLVREDVMSIVDTFFMPYGTECDLYQIMGTILFVSRIKNDLTGEKICQMRVSCNDLEFEICVNEKDLIGEPAPGRRFKGNIWLQGHLSFEGISGASVK